MRFVGCRADRRGRPAARSAKGGALRGRHGMAGGNGAEPDDAPAPEPQFGRLGQGALVDQADRADVVGGGNVLVALDGARAGIEKIEPIDRHAPPPLACSSA